jgi:hypothetical protein
MKYLMDKGSEMGCNVMCSVKNFKLQEKMLQFLNDNYRGFSEIMGKPKNEDYLSCPQKKALCSFKDRFLIGFNYIG